MKKLALAAVLLSWAPSAKRTNYRKLFGPAGGRGKTVRRIDRRSAGLALATLALAAASPAFGGTIYATGFENPPFILGNALMGQDGWVGASALSPNAAVISNDLVFSGEQVVRVRGADLVHEDFINEVTNGYYDAIGSYRRPLVPFFDVGAAGFPIVRIQANVRIDGPKTPPGAAAGDCVLGKFVPCNNFFSAGIVAVALSSTGGSPGIGELDISSDGKVYGHSGDALVPQFLTSHQISLGAWHMLAIDVDFKSRTYSFSVDGKSLEGGPFQFGTDVDTNTLKRGSLVVFTAPDTTKFQKSNYVVHDDNFSIATLGTSQTSQLRR